MLELHLAEVVAIPVDMRLIARQAFWDKVNEVVDMLVSFKLRQKEVCSLFWGFAIACVVVLVILVRVVGVGELSHGFPGVAMLYVGCYEHGMVFLWLGVN